MAEQKWSEVRAGAVKRFGGDTPRGDQETVVVDAFEREPGIVLYQIERISRQLAGGADIRAPWALLRSALTEAMAAPGRDPTVQVDDERQKALQAALNYIKNAGGYLETEQQILDDVFGISGYLADYDDQTMREAVLYAWHEERPRFERAERASLDYQQGVHQQRTGAAGSLIGELRDKGVSRRETENAVCAQLKFSRVAVQRLLAEVWPNGDLATLSDPVQDAVNALLPPPGEKPPEAVAGPQQPAQPRRGLFE